MTSLDNPRSDLSDDSQYIIFFTIKNNSISL